ncbi:MAG: GTP-binding protein [Candidatus Omnitrophica bacterium]|nr:GTP-binding protein [Candidatus Omnitrophota bacterium]
MRMRDSRMLSVAFIGHVDHGKSTLLGRLLTDMHAVPPQVFEEARQAGSGDVLAFLSDQFREEREQLQTIDTTQRLVRGSRRSFLCIDTPGHLEFLENMLTGVTKADAAVLVVDAGEGVREQTRRHLWLARLLGIEQMIVAVNKMDRVGFSAARFQELCGEISRGCGHQRVFLRAVIPVSARDGDMVCRRSPRIAWYRGKTLLAALNACRMRQPAIHEPLRMPVQDVYHVQDDVVAVGRIGAGVVRRGGRVVVLPAGGAARVKSLRKFERPPLAAARAGESIGISLSGVPLARGAVICGGRLPAAVREFPAVVLWLAGVPAEKGAGVTVRIATQEQNAVIAEIIRRFDSATLEPLGADAAVRQYELARMRIATSDPVVIEADCPQRELGRFVLEQAGSVVGLGVIGAAEHA